MLSSAVYVVDFGHFGSGRYHVPPPHTTNDCSPYTIYIHIYPGYISPSLWRFLGLQNVEDARFRVFWLSYTADASTIRSCSNVLMT